MKNLSVRGKLRFLATAIGIFAIALLGLTIAGIQGVQGISVGTVVGLAVAMGVVLALCEIWIIRDICGSLNRLITYVKMLDQGDFSMRVEEKQLQRKDEFGLLANTLDQFSINIGGMLGEVKSSSIKVSSDVDVINSNMSELNMEIENVSATTEELSASMQETAASAEQISDKSKEIESASRNMAMRAQDGAEKAAQIHERAVNAQQSTLERQQQASAMKAEISKSLSAALEEATVVQQIDVLAQSIMEITSKTNLLALNASIEAARAGDAGRGFAVVADEIRNLAEQSKTTVENIQNVTVTVTSAVENLSEDSKQLLDFVSTEISQGFHSFLDIADAYNEDASYVDELVTDFSAISQELLASVNSVLEAIEEVNSAANEGATGTSDIAERNATIAAKSSEILNAANAAEESAKGMESSTVRFIVSK